jgi:hypothetical protein
VLSEVNWLKFIRDTKIKQVVLNASRIAETGCVDVENDADEVGQCRIR